MMFLHENGFSSYACGSGRKATPEEHIRKFTWFLRAIVLGPRLHRDMNIPCFGRFSLRRRFNVDQVSFSWDGIGDYLYAQSQEGAYISSCVSGARQRLGTLHVCCCADPKAPWPRLGMILRSASNGKYFFEKERHFYHPAVTVYFNERAWATREFVREWVERDWKAFVQQEAPKWMQEEGTADCLMIQDSAAQHCGKEYIDALRMHRTESVYCVKGGTQALLPVERGLGQALKAGALHFQKQWLENDENLRRWENGEISSREKRILATHWFGKSYEMLLSKEKELLRAEAFECTGCNTDVDGMLNDTINVVGLGKHPIDMVPAGTLLFFIALVYKYLHL